MDLGKKEGISNKIIPAVLISGLFIIFSFIIISSFYPSFNPLSSNSFPNNVEIENELCIYTTGSFDGRKTQAHTGELEVVDCKHNLFFDQGRNYTRALLAGQTLNISVNVISLCNATNGTNAVTNGTTCGAPVSVASELYNVFT